jgi:ribosomal protein S12 methylthiotransferase
MSDHGPLSVSPLHTTLVLGLLKEEPQPLYCYMTEKTATKKTRVGFVSLGCPKNLVDSEVMLGTLNERGYEVTTDQKSADVIVVNTCGFIDSAKQESIDTILEMAQLKEAGNCRKLVVAGCLGERYRSEIQKEIPEIDYVFGPDELGKILEAVRLDSDTTPPPNLSIDALYTSREVPTIPRILTTPSHMAYLKISEGCDHTCAFCAIPGFRGSFRSRQVDDLIAEARRLADGGVRELVIVSQDTLAFGKDLGIERGTIRLLEGLLGVDGLRWIRLLYCYPNLLSNELVAMIGSEDRLCSYFDIPYQHASPRIMERMRRGGGREMFHRQVENIRDRVPEAGLRTSFIVGFPGETPEDFDDLLGFVEDVRFDNLGVFLYSDEDGTSAYNLNGKVDRDTAIERRDFLMKRQAGILKERLEGMVGRKMTVLLDGLSSETDLLLEGRLETQAPEIDGHVLINDANGIEPRAGSFYKVEMTDSLEYDLIGRIVEEI